MAKQQVSTDRRRKPKEKRTKVQDEEILEDEAFNEEDETKYGHYFNTKKQKQSEETGELWDYLFEGQPGENETAISVSEAPEEPPSIKVDKRQHIEELLDDSFTRQEDDENLFTEDGAKESARGFHWALDADDKHGKYASLVKKFKEIQENLPEVFQEESRAKVTREERKELYEQVKKDVSKRWEPVLQHLKQKKNIVYGEVAERSDQTCGSLTQLEAETPLEKELESEISLAYERALQAREMSKNKRIKRIKSKKWHKRQKKRDLELYAKLIEKSNDPELTKELLESFEQKRSKHRILRKKVAQQKWAKLAMRFGDRNVLKEISNEQQKLKDDLSFIKHTIDTVKEKNDLDSDESEEDNDDSELSEDEETKDEVLEKLKIIANPQETDVPKKGLFALKFMRDVIQSKIEGRDQENSTPPNERHKYDNDNDYEFARSNEDSCSEGEPTEEGPNVSTAKPAKVVSDEEFKAAMKQIRFAFGSSQDEGSHEDNEDASDVASEVKVEDTESTEQNIRSTTSIEDKENLTSVDSSINIPLEAGQKVESTSVKSLAAKLPTILEEDEGLDNFVKNLAPLKASKDKLELAKRLFVTRPDEEACLSGSENSDEDDTSSDKLKGWGSWTGYGIVNTKTEKKEGNKPKKQKQTVKISKKKDTNMAKYVLHRVPHPYKTKHDYNAKMETSIGPEWNTSKIHAQLVQPKTIAKVGSVIKPLSASSAKEYVKRMGKAFSKNRTHAKL